MNITEIMGHLGADPEVRFTSSGQKVISLRLATKVRKNGQDETVWWRVTIWEDRCKIEKMLPYLKKGSALIIVGEMTASIWTDKEGRPQISLDLTADLVRFSPFGKPESARQEGGQQAAQPYGQQESRKPYESEKPQSYAGSSSSSSMSSLPDDDEIPF